METIITKQAVEQLELFDKNRWPQRPYCTDNLELGLHIRPLKQAINKAYIQANPPHLRVWSIFDVDRQGGAIAWEGANLPPPSWASANKENGHAHLVYGLRAPVLVDSPDMRQGPLRYLCAVESLMRAKLQADSGYAGLITKNPAHPLWRTLRGPSMAYDLGDLAEWLPGLEKHIPRRGPVEEVGLGRNVTVFDALRKSAYSRVRDYKTTANDLNAWNAWMSWCNNRALERNGELHTPLDGREVWHIAKSVAKWTWRRFDVEASDARFRELQAYRGGMGGVASGLSRLAKSEDKRASAKLLKQAGHSVRAIASRLGVSIGSVSAWCSAKP